MNKIFIIGNLTGDPAQYQTQNDIPYARFTVAVRKKYHREGQPDCDFIRVTAWRGLGETCMKYLSKGRKVCVTGTPGVSCYMGQDEKPHAVLEVTADEVEFVSAARPASELPEMEQAKSDSEFPFET